MFNLAFLHLTRNRQRITLAILSAAFATLVLTFALVMSQGEPGGAAGSYGVLFGGDIVVLPDIPAVPEAGLQPSAGWTLTTPSLDVPSPYDMLAPDRLLYPHPVRSVGDADWLSLGNAWPAGPVSARFSPT